jgi:hypothetical protein
MIGDPYTYVTVLLHGREVGQLSVFFHTPKLRVETWVIDERRPHLDISSPEAAISIGTTGAGPVTDQDLDLARKIHTAATQYLADCERLHPSHSATSPSDTQSDPQDTPHEGPHDGPQGAPMSAPAANEAA